MTMLVDILRSMVRGRAARRSPSGRVDILV
jgi:hypothetical protein